VSLVPSQYPAEAVEFTVTMLIPVTDENRQDVDGAATDHLNAAGLTWWPERIAHFVDYRQELRLDFNRPPEFRRPRPKKRQA
jgi:hypothetical protein